MLRKLNNIIMAGFLFLALMSVNTSAYGKDDASIYDMAVMNSEENLLLYFRLKDAFTEEMEKGIESGIPITFTFYITLFQDKAGFAKKKIISFDFNHALSYDTLKEEYSIKFDEQDERVVMVRDLEEAKKLMSEVNDLLVIDLASILSENQYTIRAKVRLGKKILPLNFHYIIPFRNFLEFNTEWAELKFIK
jgi:hypothetical protein